jgi:predicted permease
MRWIRHLFRRSRADKSLDKELQFHLDQQIADYIAAGMDPEEARCAAMREFGNVTRVKEETREVWSLVWLEQLWQDVRYGLRVLGTSPGFTAIAVLTLALGIGANTAMFSAVNAILLRPLPYRDSSQLVNIWGTSARYPEFRMTLSVPELNDVKAQNHSFDSVAAHHDKEMNWTGHGEPEVISVTEVSQDFFKTLGVLPVRGRTFAAEEEIPGKDQVVILSDALWRSRFGSDVEILGKTITLDGTAYTVVGVMPRGFRFQDFSDDAPQLWKPLAYSAKIAEGRTDRRSFVIARLRRGVNVRQAETEVQTIAARMAKSYPKEDEGQGLSITSLKQGVVHGVQPALLILLAAVSCVLLIACVNVANLFLARSRKRQREIAIRAALGATRARLIRQLLVESVLLATAGGLAGLAVGTWGIDVIRRFAPADTPRLADISIDRSVLWFTLAVSILTGIVFGLVPALQASRPDLNTSLRDGVAISGSGYGASGHHRLRSLLVVSEVALAVVLLIGSVLMLKSFSRLTRTNPGFRTDHALTAQISVPETKYETAEKQRAFFDSVLGRIQGLPGVQSAALMATPILADYLRMSELTIEGQPSNDPRFEPYFEDTTITPDYFQAAGITLLAGRTFDARDTGENPGVVIVNETLALRYWPARQAIGKRVSYSTDKDGNPDWCEIVGVARDARDVDLTKLPKAEIYLPFSQNVSPGMNLLVRTQGDTSALEPAIRDAVWSIDRDQPVQAMATLEQAVARSEAAPKFHTVLLGIFAALGLAITLVGIYGVISYSVSQRTREIGIRMALGAQTRDVLRGVLWDGMKPALVGLAIGTIAALGLTRVLGSLLFEVSATDPATFVAVSALLACVALAACYLPARRAMRVDPMVALRYE